MTVAAARLLIPCYELQPKPLTAAMGWNVIFIAINVYWIVRLGIERRPVHFTVDEVRLGAISFPSLTAQEAKRLFATGTWDDVAPGLSLVQRDLRANDLAIGVLVRQEVRAMCWPRQILQRFLAKRPDIDLALERSVGLEVQHMLDSALSKLDPSR